MPGRSENCFRAWAMALIDYVPQCEALTYCENLVFAGYDDWRLPNVRELQSTVSYGRSEPALEPAFSGFASAYLTSTGYTADSATMGVVNFHDGSVLHHAPLEEDSSTLLEPDITTLLRHPPSNPLLRPHASTRLSRRTFSL